MAVRKIIDDYHPTIKITTILSDHGSQFTSGLWTKELSAHGINVTFSSIRHPESNPAERIMRELSRLFRTYCHNQNSSWALHLSNIENLFNTLPHSSTGYSPHEIIYGTRPPLPLDHLIQNYLPSPPQPKPKEELYKLVKQKLHTAALHRKQLCTKNDTLNLGDLVLLRVPSISDASKKIYAKFQFLYDGPFRATKHPHPNTYTITELTCDKVKRTYNIKNLKLYHSVQQPVQ